MSNINRIYLFAGISAILLVLGIVMVAGAFPFPPERWWVIGAIAITYGAILSYYTWYLWKHKA